MFATAVSLQEKIGQQSSNTAQTSRASTIAVAQSLVGALTTRSSHSNSPGSTSAPDGPDEVMAQLLQEELGDEDDGLLGIGLRPRVR